MLCLVVWSGPALAHPWEEVGQPQGQCPLSHGYWKNHPAAWPTHQLPLGAQVYGRPELLVLLGLPTKGDASVVLARQLIAAKLNVANGTNPAPVAQVLAGSDNLLAAFSGRLPYKVTAQTPAGAAMVAAAAMLDKYNNGKLPHSCQAANTPPTADAGADQSAPLGSMVTLDGSGSTDLDGDQLTYAWSLISRPASSTAVLSTPTGVVTTLVLDAPGTYDVRLVVSDGRSFSAPDVVRLSTVNSRPVADAGPDQTVAVGATVTLDGSRSIDRDGDRLTHAWSFVSIPAGSQATFVDPGAVSPMFLADRRGEYIARLIVSDGVLESEPDTVAVSTANSAPVADAGEGISAATSETVTLDGSASFDVDGDALTYAWSLTTRPAGSLATLSDPASVAPTFVVDVFGDYVAQLVVNDGIVDSGPDTVVVTTINTRPVARAGPDQQASAGDTVTLDGSGSTDIDGNPLTYQWALTTVPAGSVAALSDASAVGPTFVADLAGVYIAQLTVNDGVLDSNPDTVTVTTAPPPNRAPIADAGGNQTVAIDDVVQLDGTASSDPDGDTLSFAWSLLTRPAGSAAALSATDVPAPTFVADRAGAYVVQLIVSDGIADSPPVSVTISTANTAPVADAGANQTRATGATVRLDGSASFDADGDTLQFTWSLLTIPTGSTATLSNPGVSAPTFVADRPGVYVAQLVVRDHQLASPPVTVTITVEDGADLGIAFESPPTNPPVGTQTFIIVDVLGPPTATGVVAEFSLPAGYLLISTTQTGAYDAATGVWTIGSMAATHRARLTLLVTVLASGPYDLSAAITASSPLDPNPDNDTATAVVTPNPLADLRLTMSDQSSGTVAVGTTVFFVLQAVNLGPAASNGVTVSLPIPAGYTVAFSPGSYNVGTGVWTVGSLGPNSGTHGLTVIATVNATGPLAVSATIGGSQPDPNPANNTVVYPTLNRPPVANAGPDQAVVTGSLVALDGHGSTDPDGDALTYQWSLVLRPAGSATALAGADPVRPSFTADRPGTYRFELRVVDSSGTSSTTDSVVVTATGESRPPIILSSPVTAASVGQPYQYAVRAIDLDAGDTLAYQLTTAPGGMAIDLVTGLITWTPAPHQGGATDVVLHVQDSRGLFAVQPFAVQVSSSANQAPLAIDDTYEARVGESLHVGAPGVLANDTDTDGAPLSAVLRRSPQSGTVFQNADGSFTYTPHAPGSGLILIQNANLAARLPGVVIQVTSDFLAAGSRSFMAADDDLGTSWRPALGDPVQAVDLIFPADITVTELQVFGHRITTNRGVTEGVFQLYDASDTLLLDSGGIAFPAASGDAMHSVPGIAGVRRARFRIRAFQADAGFAEFKVIGSALVPRSGIVEPNLGQRLPVIVTASSVAGLNPPESVADDNGVSNWYATTGSAGEFIELAFPGEVTVNQIVTANPSARPDGFGSSEALSCTGVFTLLDAGGNALFDSGVVAAPSGHLGAANTFTLPIGSVAGVRRARYTSAGCTGVFPPGFSEFRVLGIPDVQTAPVGLARKFQALLGREVHSTPLVVNLTDDNFDGAITLDDVPDLIVPVEHPTDPISGELKVVSGDDGRELMTLGGPNLVSPWSEAAAGDLDGDGRPEIVAVHSDGTHLIAFDHTGATRWTSDANLMPRATIGSSTVITGAVSIANLDGAGSPEVIVGASVFSATGALLGDGRTLGGTTGGTGLRSALSAVADIDLDGVPELVAGPTAYRLVNGQLQIAWQRSDRPDGYAAIANLDADPFAEIVVVANGQVYVLNHDGSDAEVWNPPAHGPLSIPGGGQGGAPTVADMDGDGLPEVGVAGATRYVVFNRTGAIRWSSVISDRSSNATGATVFDFDGDGQVEVAYRDERFLRIYRGADGVLLAKTPVGSSTWSEQPVVADVDNDGHAELVIPADRLLGSDTLGSTGLHVFEDVADQWTRTRRIWNQHAYHVTNVNEDGTIPADQAAHWLTGLNSFRRNAVVAGVDPDGTDSFDYVATDGGLESNLATVRIAVRTPNSEPRFVSSAPASAATGVSYVYAARAVDPDPGDVLSFSLPSAPAGMTIQGSTGLIQWTPAPADLGRHAVVVQVRDARGLFALQGYHVDVAAPLTVPDVVGQTQADAGGAVTSAGLSVGAISTRHSPTVAAGLVLSQSPAAGSLAAPGAPVNLVVSTGAAPVGTVPDVVGLARASAEADVVAAGFVVGAASGQSSGTVPAGVVLAQVPPAGAQATPGSPVALTVSLGPPPGSLDLDGDGYTGDRGDCNDTDAGVNPGAFDVPGDGIDQNCNGVDSVPGDGDAPTAALASPDDLAVVTMPVDITGTATDANFLRFTVQLAEVDATTYTTIGAGTVPVAGGVVGRLDPTLLENGLYRVRLIAEDVNGQTAVDERVYRVDGHAKIGLFSLSFVDLQVPVSGIPITVVRTYDSRVKSRKDFGVGWSLQVKSGRVQHNRPSGDGWTILNSGGPFGLPCAVVSEVRNHLTEVRLSDREVYVFRPRLANVATVVGGCTASVAYDLVTGTTTGATLEALGGRDVIYTSGDQLSYFDGTGATGLLFDPRQVRITTADGRVVELERGSGIGRIQDANGNTLTITPAGIVHSSGKSVAFTRDGVGRITRITDPRGSTIEYAYTGDDLTTVTDQAGAQTMFVYDAQHNLLELVDPAGNRAVLAEYDVNGRLLAVTDARGARTTFSHDLALREEVVTDALGHAARVVYDEAGNVVSTEKTVTIEGVPVLARAQFQYDAAGNETVIVDADGRRRENAWDGLGNLLETVLDPAGLGISRRATYTASGALLSETDPNGDTTTFGVDSRGNTSGWTGVDGRSTTLAYDAAGRVIGATDPDGYATQVSYDGAGRVTTQTNALGHVTAFSYDANGNKLTEAVSRTIDGAVRTLVTRFEYDAGNRLTRIVDAMGQSQRMTYTALGQPETRVDPIGRVTAFEYDELGALTVTRFPDGTSETITYDARGDVRQVVDREGLTTSYDYDELRRPVSITGPDGVTRTVYSPGGQVVATIGPDGTRTDYEYDAAGRRVLMRQPEVLDGPSGTTARPEWRYELDAAGRTTAVIDPRGHRRAVAYDTVARTVTLRQPDGSETVEELDGWGRTVRRTDAEGHTIRFDYVADTGWLQSVTLPPPADGQLPATWRFSYDEGGRRVAETDPLGRTTRLAYDALGRLTRVTLPGGQVRSLGFDAAGQLTRMTDFDGTTSTFDYDLAGRVVARRLADGTAVTFTYTPGGRRAAVVDARGTTEYTYNPAGQLAGIVHPGTGALAYAYDAGGRVTSITAPGGTTTYRYDALGRLLEANDGLGVTQYAYDLSGNLTALDLANGISGALVYDMRNQLTALDYRQGGATIASFGYTYTPTGRRASIAEMGATTSFGYDRMGRLVSESRTGGSSFTRAYEYDAAGNRTRMIAQGVPIAYTYDANDRLLSAGSVSYTYDARGNLVARDNAGAITTYTWTPDNRLASLASSSGAIFYAYDADGMRVAKTTAQGTSRFLVDGLNPTGLRQVIEERDNAGGLARRLTYGSSLISTRSASGTAFYQSDGQSHVRQLSDSAGQVTDTYDYDAFGGLIAQTGTSTNDYRYNGQSFDSDAGVYYLRNRYYDQTTGRFLGVDPAAGDPVRPLTMHRYVYAGNDPVNFADPNGDVFTVISATLGTLVDVSKSAFELASRASQICRVKAVDKVISLVLRVKAVAGASKVAGALGDLLQPAGLSVSGRSGQPWSGTTSVTLFDYEHPLSGGASSPIGFSPNLVGKMEKMALTLKFPAPDRVDVEFGSKLFSRPSRARAAQFRTRPRFELLGLSAENEFEIKDEIEACGLTFGEVAAFAKFGAAISKNLDVSGSATFGVKVKAPFLPGLEWTLLSLPKE